MGSSCESKLLRCQSSTIQPGVFSRMRAGRNTISSGSGGEEKKKKKKKKKFTHKATPARCASHYERGRCIFLGSYMLSFDTQRSRGVRDAPSHGNTPERVHGEVQDRAFNSERVSNTACVRGGSEPPRFTSVHESAPRLPSSSPPQLRRPFQLVFFFFVCIFFFFFCTRRN